MRSFSRGVRDLARDAVRLPKIWSHSLMVRVVFLTGLFTLVGTGVIAYFLVDQVTTGLYQERFNQVQAEATAGLSSARSSFDNMQPAERASVEEQVAEILDNLGGSSALYRETLLLPLDQTENLYVTPRHTDIPEDVISEDLRNAVASSAFDTQSWQSVGIPDGSGDVLPGVAFGISVPIQGQTYGLFYVYDFSAAQQNINYVFRIFLVAVAVLLVMNMAIAAWVTRTVVKPVSEAAEVSQLIAAGQLDQRLAVVGQDEIAQLGISFNRMASALQDQINRLAELSQMQQRFVSDVSHELRTPLTTVSMAASMLYDARDDFDPISHRSAELLHHQVERFQALLADLLEMSRFDAGAAELVLSEVDMRELAQQVMESASPLAHQAQVQMHLVAQGDDFRVEVDRRRIDRILRNLINNAIEHSENQPVDVVIAASPTAVAVAVCDHGIGMAPEEVSRVFDRFWRADPARARTTGGSGLGLSIATEDTRLHQGSLDAWGQAGQGACFRLVLPRRQEVLYRASPLALPPAYDLQDRMLIAPSLGPLTYAEDHDRIREQALEKPS